MADERDIVSTVGEELRRTVGASRLVDIEVVRGRYTQDVINREVGPFDILVGIMWRRFGKPTARAESGTAEEVERALRIRKRFARPKIMFYFRTEPFYPISQMELDQFSRVLKFKERLGNEGVLYWEHDSLLKFERSVREHLIHQVLTLTETVKRNLGVKRTRPSRRR